MLLMWNKTYLDYKADDIVIELDIHNTCICTADKTIGDLIEVDQYK